jgi:uncharacterized cupredoxin-like copper-binding protein
MTPMLRWFRMAASVVAVAGIGCAGRAQSPPAPASAAPAASQPAAAPATPAVSPEAPDWLEVDAANKTATLTLEVAHPSNAPSALINGYRNGEARVVVPVGWTVKWDWRNADTAAHSLVVMVQREKLPLEGGRASLTNAMTRMVTEGLPPGGTDQTTFVAEEAGWYWLMCGVPSHALAGEWLELRVDPEATTASVQMKKT